MKKHRRLLIALALVFTAIPPVTDAADQIQMTSGARLDGEIVAMTPTEVSIDVRGTKRAVPVSEIKQVTFSAEPPELTAGRARVLVRKPENGLAELKKLDPSSVQSEMVKRDLQFYLAFAKGKVALSSGGDKNEAIESMLAFVRANPTSFHFFEAAELLGDLSLAKGEPEQAVKYYSAISSKAPWPEYKMRAMMSEASALIAQKEFSRAQEKYDAVLAVNSDTKQSRREKLFAEIGRARCLAETGDANQGISIIEKIITENDAADTELFGRAYNSLGDCLLKAGKTKDALLAYLHVDVLFYSDPEIHAESLYHLTKLWADVNNSDRAAAARTLLNERYSGSIWASKP
jgi:tetratricopeptide (TPR) repeat protein